MNLIIDANILFSVLIRSGKTEELLFDSRLNLFAPEFIFEEFLKYKEFILNKTNRINEEFETLINILEKRINLIENYKLNKYLFNAKNITPDKNDALYFACALYLNCAIWSNDKLLKSQNEILIYSTTDLLKLFKLI